MATRPVFGVVGEALIDLVEPGDDAPGVAHPGGSPFNVAVGLARLGQHACFVGRFSADAYGGVLRDHASQSGVDLCRSVSDPRRPSTVARVRVRDGIADYDFRLDDAVDFAWTGAELDTALAGVDAVHLGSLASWLAPSADVVAAAMARLPTDVLVSYDPNVRPGLQPDRDRARAVIERGVDGADVVKVSADDLAYLYGARPELELVTAWTAVRPVLVVITRGAEGATAFLDRGSERIDVPVHPLPVVDTVGAGDSFMAGLLDGFARYELLTADAIAGAPATTISEVLTRATLISAITCSRAGADPPTLAELE